jgi:hypothetical protein
VNAFSKSAFHRRLLPVKVYLTSYLPSTIYSVCYGSQVVKKTAVTVEHSVVFQQTYSLRYITSSHVTLYLLRQRFHWVEGEGQLPLKPPQFTDPNKRSRDRRSIATEPLLAPHDFKCTRTRLEPSPESESEPTAPRQLNVRHIRNQTRIKTTVRTKMVK